MFEARVAALETLGPGDDIPRPPVCQQYIDVYRRALEASSEQPHQ